MSKRRYRWMFDIDYLTDSMNYIPVSLENQANPHAGASEVTNSAGTSQTPSLNASEEKDEDVELIVVPSTVRNTEEKAASRKSSTNSKKDEILTELQQEKKVSSTDTLEDNPKVQAFRRELEEIALKHLGKVSENITTSTTSVNTGSEPVNTGSFDHDDSPMPELEIFHKSDTGIFDEASYDEEGVITDFNSLPTEIEVQSMQEELLQFKLQQVWVLVDLPHGMKVIGTKWVYRNKRDERGVVLSLSSMGELTFFLGLQVKQNKGGIFISQDKYVAEILKKFDLVNVKAAITPMETKLPLTKDKEAIDVDVTPKTSHLNAVKRIFKYLKGKPNLGLWYPRESPFDLESFSDSNYGGSNLDRKSTTAEYVAAANCYGQVLWIQNQLLDYGFNFMNTKIHIDNESTICIMKNLVYHSKTKHFWQTATTNTKADGTLEINATIDTIGSKSGGWDQFGSNIATALICLSTNRVYNFSKLIFDGMVANLKSKTKFLMYPRFLQMILNIQTENKHLYLAVSLTKKIFGNMKRGFRGAPRPLLPAMLLVATNPNAGQEHDAVAPSQPSSSTPPVPSTSSPPVITTPTPIPATIPSPTPIPETEPEPFEHIFEEPSPVHQHFSPPQEQADKCLWMIYFE
ncbi:putative ribonuclease H-like domain-containing protein [Tanacetum coccineum]